MLLSARGFLCLLLCCHVTVFLPLGCIAFIHLLLCHISTSYFSSYERWCQIVLIYSNCSNLVHLMFLLLQNSHSSLLAFSQILYSHLNSSEKNLFVSTFFSPFCFMKISFFLIETVWKVWRQKLFLHQAQNWQNFEITMIYFL